MNENVIYIYLLYYFNGVLLMSNDITKSSFDA